MTVKNNWAPCITEPLLKLFMFKCLEIDNQKNMYISDFKMKVIGKNVTLFDSWKCVRSSHQSCSIKKAVLKNSAIFTEKHLCRSQQTGKFIKNRLQHRRFPVNIAKFLRTPI